MVKETSKVMLDRNGNSVMRKFKKSRKISRRLQGKGTILYRLVLEGFSKVTSLTRDLREKGGSHSNVWGKSFPERTASTKALR